jgi:hypothetical protein
MAVRYVINYTMARKESSQAAIKFLNKVIRDIELDARFRAASGPFWTGRLASSIQHRGPTVQGTKIVASVGSKLKYAASVEAGADAHPISARGDYNLKFFWHKKATWMSIPAVNHPGQRGKEFLRGPMKRAALKFGMHYITYSRNI